MKTSTEWVSSDDGTPLFVHTWRPDAEVRAIVHIAHGLAEHAGRYARLASVLTGRDFQVHAHDHRGHGQTAPTPGDLGHFADAGGWSRAVRDLHFLVEKEKADSPGQPLFLIAHSMGALMAQDFLCTYGDSIAGCALSGPFGVPHRRFELLRRLAQLERWRLGPRGRSRLLHRLSLGALNKPFHPGRTEFDWLTRDTREVDQYVEDPLCGFPCTVQLSLEVFQAVSDVLQPERVARIPKNLPLFIFAGGRDPVSNGGKSLLPMIALYENAGLTDVRHKFYPESRHEMFNEVNRDEIYVDLGRWLMSLTGAELRPKR